MRPFAHASEPPVSETASRTSRVLAWLTSTRTGRTVLVTLLTMALVQVLRPFVGANALLDTIGLLTSVVLFGAAAVVAGQWVGRVQRVLLWRVRRKLLVSYFLIGVVPAFLLVVFFAIVGLLLFFNVGAYMLRTQVATFVDRVRVEAESTAAELRGVASRAEAEAILSRRQQAIGGSLPTLALVLLDGDGRCESAAPSSSSWAGVAAGPRVEGLQALLVPAWVPCQGYASLVDEGDSETGSHIAVRAVAGGSIRKPVQSTPASNVLIGPEPLPDAPQTERPPCLCTITTSTRSFGKPLSSTSGPSRIMPSPRSKSRPPAWCCPFPGVQCSPRSCPKSTIPSLRASPVRRDAEKL